MNKSIGICIVEDLREIRTGLENILSSYKEFSLLGSFEDAESAADKLPSLMPDIVIMDINLPGMSGIDCVKRLSRELSSVRFMMFTIYENNEHIFEALASGASGYLLKNTPPEKITEALLELYQGGSPMSTLIARKVVNSFRKIEDPNQHLDVLTNREREVLEQLAKGLLYKEIGAGLGISTGTVRQHIHKIYEKLHVQNRTEALNKAFGKY